MWVRMRKLVLPGIFAAIVAAVFLVVDVPAPSASTPPRRDGGIDTLLPPPLPPPDDGGIPGLDAPGHPQ